MEDWQGCLAPQCQTALLNAREDVDRRGGVVITVEDFLLALLESSSSASHFLRGSGVDMDELVRTIQCEQPIVTEVGGEGLLSSQLMYWLATARETFGAPAWLDWPQLLEVLAKYAERLQEKAYVAVLELVSRWPESGDLAADEARTARPGIEDEEAAPLVMADTAWIELAEDVAITLAVTPGVVVWVRGERGAGKSVWLRTLLSSLTQPYVEMDLRSETEVMASELAVIPARAKKPWPVLVLDNVTPADLLALMDRPSGLASELVQRWQGPLLLLGPDIPRGCVQPCRNLEQQLGRTLEIYDTPLPGPLQRKAILVAHQAAIERRWNILLPQSTIQFASSRHSRCVCTPGGMLQWVERAAARLELFARRGPVGSVALSGQVDTLRRQSLVAMARQEPLDGIEQSLEEIDLLRAAAEVTWHERKAAGTLNQLTVEDLRRELECWLAARPAPVHYVQHCDQQHGESASAGSGNLHS
ncbi:Clp protease N-terminal domain-containing protein [Marinobacter salexigens]|uniref:Clp protease N-terminal domain-containing protein n=1 Tax=Marinobacter salexigens TaxID=1925763 RepID=UPI000C288EDB|nr:Clp protease N-terminal domain-containing protein [Marinobacter salexigens]